MRIKTHLICTLLLTLTMVSIGHSATKMDVERWLSEIKMEQYAKNFADNAIDNKELLISLTENDLENIGVSALGHRKRIISAIETLKTRGWTPRWNTSYWLKEIGHEQYTKNFADNAITTRELLVSLTEDDLESIGISALGHRREIAAAIATLKTSPAAVQQNGPTTSQEQTGLSAPGDQKEKFLSALSALKNQAGETPQSEPASTVKPAIPSAPLTNDVVIEVHQSHTGTDLWYHVGTVDPSSRSISWGQSQKYDKGQSPMCDFDGKTVVEVHQGHDDTQLWYRMGIVNEREKTIDWKPSVNYDKGQTPIVAFHRDLVIEIHQSHTGTNLWYLVGKLDRSTGTIDFGKSHKFDQGQIPSIGFAETGKDVVVEVHQSHTGTNLWYHVGVVDPESKTIAWGESHKYGQGQLPMCDYNGKEIVEVHQSHDGTQLWYRVGEVNEKLQSITWGAPIEYDQGQIPTVALNKNVVIEMHQSHEGTNLWYHVGILDPQAKVISWGASHRYDKGRIPSIGF